MKAELRRAVSTAYYAVFHLLVHDGTDCLVAVPELRPRVARTFEHRYMKAVAQEYASLPKNSTGQYFDSASQVVPAQIVSTAESFVILHEARVQADYNTDVNLTHSDAVKNVQIAEKTFADCGALQGDPALVTFLGELWCRGIPNR